MTVSEITCWTAEDH